MSNLAQTTDYRGVYKTGFREPKIQPGDTNAVLGQWSMPDQLVCQAPTVSCSLNVRLGLQSNGTRLAETPGGVLDWSAAFLRVLWGSGTGKTDMQIAELDIMDGMSFPLIARDATFTIVYPKVTLPSGGVQPIIDVSVSVGIGTTGAQGVAGARRTVVVGDLANANPSSVFPIPAYAVSACYASSDANASVTLNQTRSPAQGALIIGVSTIQKQEFQRVPIIQAARGFSIVGPAGGSAGNRVIFFLSLA
jgi:hypothetical protein